MMLAFGSLRRPPPPIRKKGWLSFPKIYTGVPYYAHHASYLPKLAKIYLTYNFSDIYPVLLKMSVKPYKIKNLHFQILLMQNVFDYYYFFFFLQSYPF